MAATISDAGSGTSAVSAASVSTTTDVSAAAGDWLVVIVAASNDGTNGDASLTGCTNSGTPLTYTQRALINYDPGATGAGATLGIYTAPVSGTFLESVGANFSPNTAEKSIQVYKVTPGAGEEISFISADTTGQTGNATSHAAATVSVTNGDIIFGAAAIETDDAITGDTDTTNGNWSSILTRLADAGADAVTMSCSSQYKTVNATGNQAWACTTSTARDSARTYAILRSAAPSGQPPRTDHQQTLMRAA